MYGDEIRQNDDEHSNMLGVMTASGVVSSQAPSRPASSKNSHQVAQTSSPSPAFRYPTDDS